MSTSACLWTSWTGKFWSCVGEWKGWEVGGRQPAYKKSFSIAILKELTAAVLMSLMVFLVGFFGIWCEVESTLRRMFCILEVYVLACFLGWMLGAPAVMKIMCIDWKRSSRIWFSKVSNLISSTGKSAHHGGQTVNEMYVGAEMHVSECIKEQYFSGNWWCSVHSAWNTSVYHSKMVM